MLVSADRIIQAVESLGSDYACHVFTRYQSAPPTLSSAVAGRSPTFHDVTGRYSRQATLLWLRYHIAETFAFIGIFDTVTKHQILQTAELIVDHEVYGQLNLEEFLVFLRKFKQGEYGKVYQSARPNPQEFILCLRPFWSELQEQRRRAADREMAERRRRQAEDDRKNCITREEWEIIRQMQREYEMIIPGKT